MAQIFSALPGCAGLMAYWYHFAIMFEAVFILTTIDSGTRIGRFLIQEFGWTHLEAARHARNGCLARISPALIMVLSWSYFIWTGSIATIWPMFRHRQSAVGRARHSPSRTTIIINLGRAKYAG
jgi:carbon starvation protein